MPNLLTLGRKSFASRFIQGPLAGISSAPFRRLIWQYSQPAFACTEMISCKTIIHQPQPSYQRYIAKDPQEGPVCFQLSGQDSVEIAEAVKRVTDLGADLIDLNCGCPVKKIRSKGTGSALLENLPALYRAMVALKRNTHVPVSIKIRVGEAHDETFNQAVGQVIAEAGIDFVTVHGRHWTQHYETPCRYDQIQFFVETLKMPVIGNGDVACLTSLQKMQATGCAGVMIARAGVGQPWLFAELTAGLKQQAYTVPTPQEIINLFIEHTVGLAALLGNEQLAVLEARKLAKYYGRKVHDPLAFGEKINQCCSIKELQAVCVQHFCY